MVKKILIKIESRMIGRMRWQRMFEMLHRMGIRGMNYMKGHTVSESGELWVMGHVRRKCVESGIPKPVLFDVGANKGFYAECLYREFGEAMDCYCFEPARKSHAELLEGLEKVPAARAVQLGFGKENGEIELHYNHEGSTIASLYPMEDMEGKSQLPMAEKIVIRRVEDYCAEEGIERVDFLKIDVEGAEYDVLEGCGSMLGDGRIRFVQFEFGPNNMVSRTYMKDFFRVLKGYRIYRVVQDGIRLIPAYSELIEVPIVSNFFAEWAGE